MTTADSARHRLRVGCVSTRSRVGTILAATSFVLASCDPGPAIHAIGARMHDAGPAIHYVLCEGQTVEAVTVKAIRDEEDPARDEVLWAVEAEGRPSDPPYVVGEEATGFRTVVDLEGRLAQGPRFVADVGTTDGTQSTLFTVDELRQDAILDAEGEYLSPQDFAERANERCR